jgi:hypothetical protein
VQSTVDSYSLLLMLLCWLDHLAYSCSFWSRCESMNTMISFLWWIIGFYWIVSGGEVLEYGAPRLYWYVIFSIDCKLECLHLLGLNGVIQFLRKNGAMQGFNECVTSEFTQFGCKGPYTLCMGNKPLIGVLHISCQILSLCLDPSASYVLYMYIYPS